MRWAIGAERNEGRALKDRLRIISDNQYLYKSRPDPQDSVKGILGLSFLGNSGFFLTEKCANLCTKAI
jgi:hypothetical protein